MSWTETTREQYRRDGLRYASDTTDEEWKVLAPLMAKPCRVGRPREVDLRMVVNAVLYILATGCQWRAVPKDFPPRSTIQYYFYGATGESGIGSIVCSSNVFAGRRDVSPLPRAASSIAKAFRPRKVAVRVGLIWPRR